MTRSEAAKICQSIKFILENSDYTEAVEEALNMAIEALSENKRTIKRTETHACDCISRQAAIDALNTGLWGVEWDKALATAMLKDLPSAQPFTSEQIQTMQELESAQVEKAYELGKADRPTGHWIDTQVDSAGLAHRRVCSICGEEPAAWSSVNKFDFCPNCGARMESDEE